MEPTWSDVSATLLERARREISGRGIRGLDVDDLAVEALASTWRYLRARATIPPIEELYALITTIASRRAIDHLRSQESRVRRNRSIEELSADKQESSDEQDDADPELVQRLLDSLRVLTPRERQIVELHFIHDLTYAEIASLIGEHVNVVRRDSIKASRLLRSVLKD